MRTRDGSRAGSSDLEVGAKDVQVLAPQQPKDQSVALRLEENRKLVGAVKFLFYLNNTMFKIESVVDSQCRPVSDFVNATRGGDKEVLQNYDDLQVRFESGTYTISLDYGAGKIDADFVKISPAP